MRDRRRRRLIIAETGTAYVTKSGRVLSPGDIIRLQEEAEKGYDVSHLIARSRAVLNPGRPGFGPDSRPAARLASLQLNRVAVGSGSWWFVAGGSGVQRTVASPPPGLSGA